MKASNILKTGLCFQLNGGDVFLGDLCWDDGDATMRRASRTVAPPQVYLTIPADEVRWEEDVGNPGYCTLRIPPPGGPHPRTVVVALTLETADWVQRWFPPRERDEFLNRYRPIYYRAQP